jgi:hypothetical protein
MCVTGVAPFVLVMTGLWVWSRKRRSERIEERRRESASGATSRVRAASDFGASETLREGR